jgi:tripartite-type tricarboxylate transporter receptor subunit TctC
MTHRKQCSPPPEELESTMNFLKLSARLMMALCAIAVTGSALAQPSPYPSRPVVLLLPYSAGGPVDALARQLASKLAKTWNQPVVADNRAGANGLIATQALIKAQPDGHTLMLHLTGMIQNPLLYKGANYDPLKDVLPVAQIGTQTMALAVPGKGPLKSMDQLVEEGKRKPGGPSYGTIGVGQTGHIWSELLLNEKNFKGAHIAYKGAGPMIIDLLNERLDWAFLGPVDAIVRSADQSVRLLAVTGSERIRQLPNVPTMAELGYPGFELTGWYGVFAPAKTPKDVVAKIEKDVKDALQDPEIQKILETMVVGRTGLGSEAFAKVMKNDTDRWQALIKKFDIKAD